MKEKAIIFIVGLLVGAIISTGSIYIYTVASNKENNNTTTEQRNQMPGNPPSNQNGNMGEPPSGFTPNKENNA